MPCTMISTAFGAQDNISRTGVKRKVPCLLKQLAPQLERTQLAGPPVLPI